MSGSSFKSYVTKNGSRVVNWTR